ncbi:MAG TPA: hypothetical protein VMF61_01310 [Candidatus Acidoferrales bacterium]|nr:hypothetical protein [Candidatus Acidoferrales bacterium]
MKKSLRIVSFAVLAASVLAACNSNNSTPISSTPTCGLQGNTVMVYPIPGAVRVPDNTTNVYIASSNNTLANGNFNTAVQPPNGLPYFYGTNFSQIPESQIPHPHASPSITNPTYYVSNVGPLSSGSTYVIGFNVENQVCNPAGIGQFTTR